MKVPCGGFDLDESVFNVDKNSKQVKLNSPISYDYMPEGYPSKDIEYVTLMEEQEVAFVAFSEQDGLMGAVSPVALAIKQGDKVTVVWDGVSYDAVVKERVIPGPGNFVEKMFGNLALINRGESEDYPFVYMMVGSDVQWVTADTATSHTIKVMCQQETITPMSTDFTPKNLNVVFRATSLTAVPTSCNVTYDELRGWVENDIPVLAVLNAGKKVCVLGYIIIGAGYIVFSENSGDSALFKYNSDGTFSGGDPE